jgi:ADP-heptose:LPS heptosyltransferase
VNPRPEKILALQFKYFGDAVLMTPALRALRGQYPNSQLHLLVPAEMAPLFQHLAWLDRVWAMPRRRGRASLRETWPLIRALRNEHFDRSVDFATNDRGAILSRLSGARRRLGWSQTGGFFGRSWCYNENFVTETHEDHESVRLVKLLSAWKVTPPNSFEPEIRSDPARAAEAKKLLPEEGVIICHIASSQSKKEWPVSGWAEFYRLATAAGYHLVFTTARGEREAGLMKDFRQLAPKARVFPEIPDLALFLAVLNRGAAFISGDTGPLHFAAGLGVPTISLFGPTPSSRWAPLGARHKALTGGSCHCDGHSAICQAARHCLAKISPQQVLNVLEDLVIKPAN